MAQGPNGLNLVVELVSTAQAKPVAKALTAAFTASGPVNILHYAWTVLLPTEPGRPPRLLLSTVYDESFDAYIADLVHALPGAFDEAARGIVGMEAMVPIAQNIPAFTAFLKARDLTNGGSHYASAFFRAYPWTVNQILAKIPSPPPKKAAAKKPG